MKFIRLFLLLFLMLFLAFPEEIFAQHSIALIPYPSKIIKEHGTFKLTSQTGLISHDSQKFKSETEYLRTQLQSQHGVFFFKKKGKNTVELRLSAGFNKEGGYSLSIKSDKILISASDRSGLFYGIQSLLQLIELNKSDEGISLPALNITDAPAFTWRGSMLDVSRHFFTIDYLKQHIDRLAFYKMNKFHLHLTDDQGWRIEIKKYPELTSKGAYRTFNNHDTLCMNMAKDNPDLEIDRRFIHEENGKQLYGGYYTQEQPASTC